MKKTEQPIRREAARNQDRKKSRIALAVLVILLAVLSVFIAFTREDPRIRQAAAKFQNAYLVQDIVETHYSSICHFDGIWKVDYNNQGLILCDDAAFTTEPQWVRDGAAAAKRREDSELALFAGKFLADAERIGCVKPVAALGIAYFENSSAYTADELAVIRSYMVMYLWGCYSPYEDQAAPIT